MPGEKTTNFLGCSVTKQHHTLTQIPMGLLKQEFELKAVEEAQPSEEMMEIPGMKDELRRPIMLLVKAQVKQTGRNGINKRAGRFFKSPVPTGMGKPVSAGGDRVPPDPHDG